MAVKLRQERKHRDLLMAKKKEEKKREQEKIRESLLKESPTTQEVEAVMERGLDQVYESANFGFIWRRRKLYIISEISAFAEMTVIT